MFDASSRSLGQLSLNDVLHAGPNLNQSVIELLLKVRTYNVAVMADIEKAFLQIHLAEVDRNALRYFWFESPLKQGE